MVIIMVLTTEAPLAGLMANWFKAKPVNTVTIMAIKIAMINGVPATEKVTALIAPIITNSP